VSAHPRFLRLAAAALAALCGAIPAICHAQGAKADAALVARGEYLAKAGDCFACHSTPRGKPFAGGLPMTTPMGRIYSTNITPDRETGIGRYSEADFAKAVREGVAPDGRALYPAMPYPSYAKVGDADMKALYAYFMQGVTPVRQANRATDIPWPLNMRWPLKIWNVVFLDNTRYQTKADKDAQWNRGAYLVQGLGHCGACHTPRGIGFQEKALDESGRAFLTGAPLENWFASNLTGNHNTGLGRWSEDDLNTFLRTGANAHATAFGSMTDVINYSTQTLSEADTRAIARYIKSLPGGRSDDGRPYMPHPDGERVVLAAMSNTRGAHTYATYCMHCHGAGGNGAAPWLAPLAGNPNVLEPDPVSLINVTLNGTGMLVIGGVPVPYSMPKYHAMLTDAQIADVLSFVRSSWNNDAPAVSVKAVEKVRNATREP
jgi:alcohol dehydrogenase (quinone), cytochrome c subunit